MNERVQVQTKYPNAIPHLINDGVLYYSQKNKVLAISDLSQPEPRIVAAIPWGPWQLISHIRLAERVLKNGILQLHRNDNGQFLAMTGHNWWLVENDGETKKILRPSATRPMSRGICQLHTGETYVADYMKNSERGPVRIYRSNNLRNFEPCWEFPAGSVRHIHALVVDDESKNRIWILTGDTDDESVIWYTDNHFSSVQTFLGLGQMSRLVDLVTAKSSLLWGTDSPDSLNFLVTCSKSGNTEPEIIQELPGPVYYSGRNEAGATYFGTTVEQGDGVLDNYGRIFGSTFEGKWQEIYRAEKDRTSQHGIVYFPRGIMPDNWLVFSQRALVPDEGCMYLARDNAWQQ